MIYISKAITVLGLRYMKKVFHVTYEMERDLTRKRIFNWFHKSHISLQDDLHVDLTQFIEVNLMLLFGSHVSLNALEANIASLSKVRELQFIGTKTKLNTFGEC